MPFLSRHIGSTPGDGPSGMHVHPFVPGRSTFIDGMSMTAAPLAMSAGAAEIALRILSASVAGGFTGPTPGVGFGACAETPLLIVHARMPPAAARARFRIRHVIVAPPIR